MTGSQSNSLGLLGALAALSLVACSAAPQDPAASSAEPLASPTSTFLVPTDDAVRVACRGAWTTRFCAADDARAAGRGCVAAMTAAPACARDHSCFEVQTTSEPCAAAEPAYPDAASCATPRVRNCAFYAACVDDLVACGESGYPLGYGEKYCTRYLLDGGFTPAGIAWRDHVMQCLQQSLVPVTSEAPAPTCDAILSDAFDSHPRCYTDGPSICFLPPSDVARVLGAIDGKDLLSLRSAKQMASVAFSCVGQLGRALLGGAPRGAMPEELRTDEALRAQRAMWQSIARSAR